MSCSSSNSIVSTLSSVFAEATPASIFSFLRVLIPALESWHIFIYHMDIVPPFPVVIDLVFEPDVNTSSDCHISWEGCVEIFFNYCICSIDIGEGWNWNHSVYRPFISVSGALWLSARKWQLNSFCEFLFSKIWNSNSSFKFHPIFKTLCYWPWTSGSYRLWFLEGKFSWLAKSVTVILGENQWWFFYSLLYLISQLRNVSILNSSLWPIRVFLAIEIHPVKAVRLSSMLLTVLLEILEG